jgi:ABC-type multidrug transport system fused ATPase/permease subunit
VAAVALLGALSVRGIQSQNPGGTLTKFLQFTNLSGFDFRTQAAVIALFAAGVLIFKTLASVFLSRKIIFFLSNRSATLSGELIEKAFNHSYLFLKSFTQQELLFATTAGVNALMVGVIASAVSLVADAFLLVILTSSLFIVEPTLSLVSIFIFSSVAVISHKVLTLRAGLLGAEDTKLNISSTSALVELLSTFRETFVQGSLDHQIGKIKDIRLKLSRTYAELSFMPSTTKYIMEVTLIFSALILGAFAFILDDAVHAIAMLVLFMAAGFRIAPAVLRIQQGLLQIKGSLASALPTLKLASMLELQKVAIGSHSKVLTQLQAEPLPQRFETGLEVEVKDLKYFYPGESQALFSGINFTIESGKSVALVGSSGIGKTTLADLILGILKPVSGSILINGFNPRDLCALYPGTIGYCPQNSFLINGTLRDNLLLGLRPDSYADTHLLDVLEKANLLEYVNSLNRRLDTIIGDSGIQLSGGEKQRLGIARALVTNPSLLVLDEATSALDAQTESQISQMLSKIEGESTLIVIAHRLATIRNFQKILYLGNGHVTACDSFDELRKASSEFNEQAKLLGL